MRDVSLPVIVRLAVCGLLSLAPLLGWLMFGTVEPYGAPHPEFPSRKALVWGQAKAFDSLGDAVLRRSIVTPKAISIKNAVNFRVLHQVDTSNVLSGHGDWLFYKPEFWDGKCLDPSTIRELLAKLDALTDMAKAAGLDMIASVSPDKSSVYPEKLAPEYGRFWNCKSENSELWRRIAASEAPRLVDHRIAILAAKEKKSGPKLFFHTDTHWSKYGAAIAFRQLLRTMFPSRPIDAAPLMATGEQRTRTDLANGMLLLWSEESEATIDDRIASVVQDQARTLIAHDSFYDQLPRQLKAVFPNSVDLKLEGDKDAVAGAVSNADRLILNSVERELFHRLEGDNALGPSGPFSEAIVARNAKAAVLCRAFHRLDVATQSQGVIAVPVPVEPAGTATCLSVEAKNWQKKEKLRLILPKAGDSDALSSQRSVLLGPDESGVVRMVLPENVQGRSVSIELPAGAELVSMEIGEKTQVH